MTVSSEVKRKDYAGNGSTNNFATVFRFLQNSDVKVILTVDSTGVETVQTEITNYTLTGDGNDLGGTVVMIIAPATGVTLTIKRDVPLTQGTDYVENDDFPAQSHEDALDKLTMIVQQQQEEIDRSLKLAETDSSSGLTLPSPSDGLFLQWDVNDDLVNVDILLQGALAVSDFAKTYLDDLTAGATRTTLDAMGRVTSGVTDNLVTLDSSDDAQDSGVAIESVPLDAIAGGTVDAITATFSPAFTALNDIKLIRVRASGANATTTPTFSPDGLTAKTIVKSGNDALDIGDIAGAGHEMLLARNSVNDNYELLNPTSVLARRFESTAQTIVSAGQISIAHGLGKNPRIITGYLVNTTTEFGYSVGNRVEISLFVNSTSATSRHNGMNFDTVNLRLRMSSMTNVFVIGHKDDGTTAALTNGNWDLFLRAFA